MKKIFLLTGLGIALLVLANCGPSKKATGTTETTTTAPAKFTYQDNLQAVIMANCTPCHIPAKGGFKKAYDNYTSVKTDIDEMIRRIQLNPGDKGFMPFKKTTRLSDSTVNVFKQWKTDGLLEK